MSINKNRNMMKGSLDEAVNRWIPVFFFTLMADVMRTIFNWLPPIGPAFIVIYDNGYESISVTQPNQPNIEHQNLPII